MEKLVSICMPVYNGAPWIAETMESILNQSFRDYELIIVDDNSTDSTVDVIKRFADTRIRIYKNERNLGCGKNLQVLNSLVRGEILFLMGQDDILLKDALLKTRQAFLLDKDVGVVTRPYYWFEQNYLKPVRAVEPYNKFCDSVISVFDGQKEIHKIFESVGQFSGLAYRKIYMDIDFHEETFPTHIYPFASVMKKHKVVFLKDYTVAVRIESSQTRLKPSIYNISPTESWVRMFKDVYREEEFVQVRKTGIEQIATHFVGLIQLKTYSTFRNLFSEVVIMVKYRPANLCDIRFWFFLLITFLLPRRLVRWLADNFKRKIIAGRLKVINIDQEKKGICSV